MRAQQRRQRGFILPLTIFILVAVAIVAVYLGERVQRSLQLARAQQRQNDAAITISDTRAEILLRLGTEALTACGLGAAPNCVSLDDRPYAFGNSIVRLQDTRGLMPLNRGSDAQLDRLLAEFDLPEDQRAHLIDSLRDYVDTNGLKRLNGADAADYAAAGMPGPRNAPLRTSLELKAVMGWRDATALWGDSPISDITGIGDTTDINPNTAPIRVLQSLPGITAEMAQEIVRQRQLEPVAAGWVDVLAGGGLMQFPPLIKSFPADAVRVTQSAPEQPWAARYNVKLTPSGETAPWQISYYYRLEQKPDTARADPTLKDTARLPPRSVLSAAPAFGIAPGASGPGLGAVGAP